MVYLQGEINVSNAGPVRFDLIRRQGPILGRRAAVPVERRRSSQHGPPGRHTVTLESTRQAAVTIVKVEVTKPSGSPAEFTVVGGR